jgi:cysteine synthase
MESWNWEIVNRQYLENTIKRCREKNIILPTFVQLKNPGEIPSGILQDLKQVDLQEVHPLNLFRINWRNDPKTNGIGEINYLEIPKEISGVEARIIGLVGKHFPTGAHKVGATYGCLAPYLVTGRFDPEYHKAVWPSTGNYCRGGAFNSALLSEVFATPGCESNVKEIYDKCHELVAESDEYLIFNQFDQFGNSVWHYEITGSTIETLFNQIKEEGERFSGYISATGSAGTIAAGDYLREKYPFVKVLASEALQCPTLLSNGFGGHRIEGIGDKHVPWIHNVKNTDAVAAIDDEESLRLLRLFNEKEGHDWLASKGVNVNIVERLPELGISSIANLLCSIKLAKYYELNKSDVIFTIFTDSSDLYQSRLIEMNEALGSYTQKQAEIDWNVVLKNQKTDNFLELGYQEKKRIHNLKYFTWVEQQGKDVEELNAQWYDENYWKERFSIADDWDKLITDFNKQVGLVDV